ncbi:hypothetical protein [Acinetobacter gandensis]|uniref:Uncharacterized protein n=2 Tax=Acinetobacter gandensis TaxID=1443941 RepID=A0A1A7R7N0_9GAMM|nr:hypothetical protein [Acinetobacter gandensis]OBX27891.1 hypothetical protein A9J31_09310 [Acinetobacter gandensis]
MQGATHANESVLLPIRLLSQTDFDHQIELYTAQINETKLILDVEDSTVSPEQQTKAFCTRLNAYQRILEISQENAALNMAGIMQTVAERYLQQQQESMQSSGLNESAFCSTESVK